MKNNSLPFSQVVRKRIWALWAVLALLLIFMVAVEKRPDRFPIYHKPFTAFFINFFYFGGVIYTIYKIHYNRSFEKQGETAAGKNFGAG